MVSSITQKKKTLKKNKRGGKIKSTHFTEEDYRSSEGFLTSVWGPPMWHALHTISFNYPVDPTQEQKKQYRDFILQLQYVLPCKYCRINLEKNFKQMPLTWEDMKDRFTFSFYIYRLHEMVNQLLGKKSGLSYEDVRDRYENFRARGCSTSSSLVSSKDKTSSYSSLLKKTRKRKKEKGRKREKGCVQPMHGKKSKCIIKIVPQEKKEDTFQMDKSIGAQ
jgi:hypothetical protein